MMIIITREWIVTAAHCICANGINLTCAREGRQLVPKVKFLLKIFLE